MCVWDKRLQNRSTRRQEAVKWELAELKNERRGKRRMCLGSQDSVVRLSRENRQCGKYTVEHEWCHRERWLWLSAVGAREALAGTREEMIDREGGQWGPSINMMLIPVGKRKIIGQSKCSRCFLGKLAWKQGDLNQNVERAHIWVPGKVTQNNWKLPEISCRG